MPGKADRAGTQAKMPVTERAVEVLMKIVSVIFVICFFICESSDLLFPFYFSVMELVCNIVKINGKTNLWLFLEKSISTSHLMQYECRYDINVSG